MNMFTPGVLWSFVSLMLIMFGLTRGYWYLAVIGAVLFALYIYKRIRPLMQKHPVDPVWKAFVKKYPDMKDQSYQLWIFNAEEGDMTLCQKIESGVIRGQSFSVDFYDANQQEMPSLGDINVLCCDATVIGVCKTINITRVSFSDVTDELASIEGFTSADEWKSEKQEEFALLAERMGMPFTEKMELLFEEFQIIYRAEKA